MSLERDPSTGSTLGLDFSKGRVFADEIYKSSGLTVHPMGDRGAFKFFSHVNIEQQECCVNFCDFSGFVWKFYELTEFSMHSCA